jgi:hypothetical protein
MVSDVFELIYVQNLINDARAGYIDAQKSKLTGVLPTTSNLPTCLQAAHNHIWFLEVVDATGSAMEENPPPYESDRYAEIPAGSYYLRNIGTSQYIFVDSGPWRLYPGGKNYQVCFL